MTNPIANMSGLSSGMQWNDIVDSIVAAEEARTVTRITDRLTREEQRREAWTSFRSLVDTLNDKARQVRVAGFGGARATAPASPASGLTLFGASASALAAPGRYRVEVEQLAEAERIGGRTVADREAPLGVTGSFVVNGATIGVQAVDSLVDIRDRINAANAGASPTGVTAAVVNDGPNGGRLVLTRTTAGADGITVTDGSGGAARALGFVDTRSALATSTTIAVAAAFGLSATPPPASIRIGDRVITVDLATDSLATIVSRIIAAGGQAHTEEVPFGDSTRHRLVVDGLVKAEPGPNSQTVIDALGLAAGTTGSVRQVVASGVNTTAGGAAAGGATGLVGLRVNGSTVGVAAGDAINVRGTRGDGSTFTVGLVVQAGDTVDDLLARLNDTDAFGGGERPATALIGTDGRVRAADSQGGSSRLALVLEVVRADGSAGVTTASSVETAGRDRQLQAGRDALIRVDGAQYARGSNTIADVIPNVTLSLVNAEAGTAVDLDVSRNLSGATDAMRALVDAYNEARGFFDAQRQVAAPLYGNTLLRTVMDSFTAALRTEAAGNATYTRGTLAGVTLDQNGRLTFDTAKFEAAVGSAPAEIDALFGFTGIGGAFVAATDQATAFGTGTISVQLDAITGTTDRLRDREVAAQRRLETRRAALVAQFTRMETALGAIRSQGTALTGILNSIGISRR